MNIQPRPRDGDRPDRPSSWRLSWYLPPGPNGKRQRATETFHGTKTAAEARWRERQTEIERAEKGYIAPARQSLGDYLEHWLIEANARIRPGTSYSYERQVHLHISPHLGQVPLADLTAQRLQAWIAGLSQPKENGRTLSPRSVAYVRSVLGVALGEAVRLGLLPTNPVTRVRPPKQDPKQVKSFTYEQAQDIDEAGRDMRLSVLFSVLWRTGLRIGEAIGLRWSDLDLDSGTLSVHRTLSEIGGKLVEGPPKTKAGRRDIALERQVVDLLRQHRQAQGVERLVSGPDWNPTGLVFPSEAGTPLFRRNVRRSWTMLLARAGLPAYGLHAMRHTCASLMLQAGVGLAEIAAHLGDENTAFVAKTYAHVLQATKRQAADRFGRFLAGQRSD
ncbi:MAG: tyrosine-type recombinase/integrase [Sulfobacillus sp.]